VTRAAHIALGACSLFVLSACSAKPSGPPGPPTDPVKCTPSQPASTSIDPGTLPPAKGSGVISLTQSDLEGAAATLSASASFTESSLPPMPTPIGTCYGHAGLCDVCELVDGSTNTSAMPVAISAGDVTISSSCTKAAPFRVTVGFEAPTPRNGNLLVPSYRGGPGAPLAVGDVAIAQAIGADVPPFTLAVTVPAWVQFTTPSIANETCSPIDRTKDLALAWNAVGDGTVFVMLSTFSKSGPHTAPAVECSFPIAPGGAVIPKEALSMLDAVSLDYSQLTANVMSEVTQRVGDFDVRLELDRIAFGCNVHVQ
jgi:hypothetical protein